MIWGAFNITNTYKFLLNTQPPSRIALAKLRLVMTDSMESKSFSRSPHGIVVRLDFDMSSLKGALEAMIIEFDQPERLTHVSERHYPDICKLNHTAMGHSEVLFAGVNFTLWSPALEPQYLSEDEREDPTPCAPVVEGDSSSDTGFETIGLCGCECADPRGIVLTACLLLMPFLLLWNYWRVSTRKTPEPAENGCAARGRQRGGSRTNNTAIATRKPAIALDDASMEKFTTAPQQLLRHQNTSQKRGQKAEKPGGARPWSMEDILNTELFFLAELRKLASLTEFKESSKKNTDGTE